MIISIFYAISWVAFGFGMFNVFLQFFDRENNDYYSLIADVWFSIFWLATYVCDTFNHSSIVPRAVDILFFAISAFAAWHNRNNRKKRKSKLQELGEKSKQKIKKMVEKLVPSPIPSPV